jgi:hypothetical protein
MSRYFRGMAMMLSLALISWSACSRAAVLFEDGFEAGVKRSAVNGISWGGSTDNVRTSSTRSFSGSYALEFPFAGVPVGQDSFEEQRVLFGKPYNEIWIKYDLYVPSNYYHRADSPSNNKFFAIFNNNYRPGFQVNYSTYAEAGGASGVGIHYYKNGVEQATDGLPRATLFSSGDRGKWHRIVMHFKVPTSLTSADGVMELWKNGQTLISVKNLPSNGTSGLNYIDEAYILGWANSGFTEKTVMYVDNVLISDSPIALTEAGATQSSPPVAPVLKVQ